MKLMYDQADPTLRDLGVKLASENGSEHLEQLKAPLRGENLFPVNVVSVPGKVTWETKGDLIYITLPPSEGVTGLQWIEYFAENDTRLSDDAQTALRSPDFKPTVPDFVHKIVALRATFWKKDSERTTKAIQAEGVSRKWLETHAEAVCIFRKCFSNKQLEKMGLLWMVGIHKKIEVHGRPHFLGVGVGRGGVGGWLGTDYASPVNEWRGGGAFFWSLPQENQS